MKQRSRGVTDSFANDLPLDDEHAHILIEYDHAVITLDSLTAEIETTGAKILQIFALREGPGARRSVLIRLGTQDARNAILNLSKFPLVRVEGYNSKLLNRNQSRKRQ